MQIEGCQGETTQGEVGVRQVCRDWLSPRHPSPASWGSWAPSPIAYLHGPSHPGSWGILRAKANIPPGYKHQGELDLTQLFPDNTQDKGAKKRLWINTSYTPSSNLLGEQPADAVQGLISPWIPKARMNQALINLQKGTVLRAQGDRRDDIIGLV